MDSNTETMLIKREIAEVLRKGVSAMFLYGIAALAVKDLDKLSLYIEGTHKIIGKSA